MKEAKNADGEHDLDDQDIGLIPQANFSKAGLPKAERVKAIESLAGCLFTDIKSESFEQNLESMFKKFGFCILEEKSCVDKEGLVAYLAEKIHKDFSCVYCCRCDVAGLTT